MEPDYDFGFTAIATGPLDDQQRKSLSNYRLWRHQAGADGQPSCSFTGGPGTNSPVAQIQERSGSNPRDVGW